MIGNGSVDTWKWTSGTNNHLHINIRLIRLFVIVWFLLITRTSTIFHLAGHCVRPYFMVMDAWQVIFKQIGWRKLEMTKFALIRTWTIGFDPNFTTVYRRSITEFREWHHFFRTITPENMRKLFDWNSIWLTLHHRLSLALFNVNAIEMWISQCCWI